MCFSTHEFLQGMWILQHLIAPCLSTDILKRPFRHLQILGQFQFCLICTSYLMKIANGHDADQNKHGVGDWGVGGAWGCFTRCLFALPACCWQWSAASEWGISLPDKLSHSFLPPLQNLRLGQLHKRMKGSYFTRLTDFSSKHYEGKIQVNNPKRKDSDTKDEDGVLPCNNLLSDQKWVLMTNEHRIKPKIQCESILGRSPVSDRYLRGLFLLLFR